MNNDSQPWEEWRQYADEDQLVAQAILEAGGPANPVCFHAYQLAEKYLKCFLSWRGIF
ncbi:MAG: HEPN domain-containing protein [Candidatus Liptonbacteria bacterium]|nr:HEPN domain-containing protein [Candidatus Liptonbacteria bacterium]